jgi:subtilisin-like proprotein convertase family protein
MHINTSITHIYNFLKKEIGMKRYFLTSAVVFMALLAFGQSAPNLWKEVNYSELFLPENSETIALPADHQLLTLEYSAMVNHLRNAPQEGSPAAKAGTLQVQLPMPDGTMETFRIWESSVMHPDLAAKFPGIRTFAGRGLTNPAHTVRLGYGHDGFHAVIVGRDGGSLVVPVATNQTQYYACFPKSNFIWEGLDVPPVPIKVEMEGATAPLDNNEPAGSQAISLRGGGDGELTELRAYQFALACTGEYAVVHGGTMNLVMSSLVLATNTLNSVLERDMDMRLVLIANNDLIVFLNPNSDPYNNSTLGGALLGQNENVLNQVIGLSNFDVGHVFTGSCSDVGGVVSGSVCSAGKARGVTCHFSSNVVATTLSIAAHEMGHQFTGGHTFNNCPGQEGQFHSGSAYEPGSGSTILSYQGACGQNNIPGQANVHYHGGTIEEFWTYTHNGGGDVCPSTLTTSNHAPAVELPYENGFYIPVSTPFELRAIASDADGDPLTYCWEQANLGPNAALGNPIGDSPLFRSFDPSNSPRRIFPRLATLLNNGSENTEVLPGYTRNLKFRCTVRDNNVDEGAAGVTWKDVSFQSTASAGPFLVNYPNTPDVVWKGGEEVEVTWDVANTDNSLVNCKAVNIRLSLDGGYTWPHLLATATPNDGSELVFVPDVTAANARIRIEAANNIFFDISNSNFSIQPAETPRFTLAAGPQLQQICVPGTANVAIATGSVLNYDAPIELSVIGGLPAGVDVTFSLNPVAPGQTSELQLDMGDVTADGFFEMILQAVAGTDTIYRTLFANVVYSDFSALQLQAPFDGQSSLGLLPAFSWTDLPQADRYDFQLASHPGFQSGSIIDEAFGLTEATFIPSVALVESKIYYWRVRPSNECGTAEYTSPVAFQTRTVACETFPSNDIPKPISSIGLPVINSKLPILQNGVISDINVSKIKGNHDALLDLEASLISPAGTEVVLFSEVCGNTALFDLALNDESPFEIQCPPLSGLAYKPQEPLANFIGENTLGEWTLRVAVVNPLGQGGSLEQWSLQFCASVTPKSPYLVNNDTLYVKPLAMQVIYNSDLAVADEDNSGSQLKFRIVDPVSHGYLSREGVQLSVNDQFSMLDIHQGKISYTNTNGDAVYDFFTFIVEDGTGGWTGTPTFHIVIDEDAVTGLFESQSAQGLFLFPNPADEEVQLLLEQPVEVETRVWVSDMQGRRVREAVMAAGQDQLLLGLGGLPSGIYFVSVRTDAGLVTRRFVVQH